MKCPNCEKELEQIEGKRAKQFCNSTCRSNHWQKEKRKVSFIDKKGKITNAVAGKSVTVTLKPENYYSKSQNKPHTDTKKDLAGESMPEGLNWKERIEWTRNYKQKLKNLKT